MLQTCSPGWPELWKRKFFLCTIDNVVVLPITSVYYELLGSPVHLWVSELSRRTQIIRALRSNEFLEKCLTPGLARESLAAVGFSKEEVLGWFYVRKEEFHLIVIILYKHVKIQMFLGLCH